MSQPLQLGTNGVGENNTGVSANTQPIVHIRGDSDSDLLALFDVLNKDKPPAQSFKNKKLPPSFFQPPQPGQRGSHSREGSQDSAAGGFAPGPRQVSGLVVSHARSQSSPAQLPISLPSAPPPIHSHAKQPSVDILLDDISGGHSPLQPWDGQTKPGQRYFLQNPSHGQQWQQPLEHQKSSSNQSLNSLQQPATPTLSPSSSLQHSPAVSQPDLVALPMGWEQGVTPEGEVYYINHLTKTTSWFDPRIPKHLQKPGPIRVGQQLQQQQSPQQLPPPLIQPIQPPQLPGQQNVLPGQPPAPSQLSPNQPQQQPLQRRPAPNDKYIALELQKLQREKERLQREQEEIAAKENMLQDLMTQQLVVTAPQSISSDIAKPNISISQQAAPPMQAITTNSVDPFLGQAQGNSLESHARQNSADSGLGGMGTGYSLPRTPEDFLSNVDEMDTQDGGLGKMHKHLISSDFNMNELQCSTMGMDLEGLGDPSENPAGSMDSDELVPSLQEDIGNELLNMHDMDVPKMENMGYL